MKVKTTVLPGHRIEVTDPELTVGQVAEVIVLVDQVADQPRISIRDLIDQLPDPHHTPEEWVQIEAELQADRDSWDR